MGQLSCLPLEAIGAPVNGSEGTESCQEIVDEEIGSIKTPR